MSASSEIFTPSAVRAVESQTVLGPVGLEEDAHPRRLLHPPVGLKATTRRLKALLTLAKPEITLMVVISAGVAFLMASDALRVVVLLNCVLGTGLLGAGASALNQYLERGPDGRMRRTSRRPLPSGDLTAGAALLFGLALSACGTLYLFLRLNALTALLGLLTLVGYLFVYTPLKKRTPLCTLLGAFPGAAPVLMGWAAARNSLAPLKKLREMP
jgi:heme o synthase